MKNQSELMNLSLGEIRINGGTQQRVEINEAVVAEYAEVIRSGTDMPPIVVFDDGAELWVAEGFHRYHAYRQAGATEITCEVRKGTKREAILFSAGANATHGLRRTNADKRKAVETLLNDTEWSKWSSRDIAKTCGVSHDFVSRIKTSLSSDDSDVAVTFTTKHGTPATMNTVNIGKKNGSQSTAPAKSESIEAAVDPENPDYVETYDDAKELEITRKELFAANEKIEALSDNDLAKELLSWKNKFDSQCSRNDQLNTTLLETTKKAQQLADLLAKIRKALGIEKNSQILTALTK